jgi:alpha-1,2-mannosyltransferase
MRYGAYLNYRSHMKAVVLHHSLNKPGGEASLAIHTIESLHDIGYDVDLVTIQKPDFKMIARIYGRIPPLKNIKCLLPFKVNYFGIYQRLLMAAPKPSYFANAHIIINTNGDSLPLKIPRTAICMLYVHFPISLLSSQNNKYNRSKLWNAYFKPYQSMASAFTKKALTRSNIVIANSLFTREALIKAYPEIEAHVLYPPVDIERFTTAYHSNPRGRKVLAISRFSPEKQINRILNLAKRLDDDINFQVVGSVAPANWPYFNSINKSINEQGLRHKIKLIPNATNKELIEVMSSCNTYFHTMEGEHFGVSIIEAMAAGLTPIVPSYGGCSEIVSSQCQYDTVEEAAEKITAAIYRNSRHTREYFRNLAQQFSLPQFTKRLHRFIQHRVDSIK